MFKKKYGQNFLTNNEFSQKIVNSLNILNKCILEVGTGNLALTKYIIKKNPKKFISLEIDKDLFKKNTKENPEMSTFFLNIDCQEFNEIKYFNQKYSIISNLPFNISSQLILKWTEQECFNECIEEMVLMFQKELGERISSIINTKKFGKISVLVQSIFKIEKLFIVKSNNFYPLPKVDAIVLKFTPLNKKKISAENYLKLNKITSFFFSNKRRKNIKKIKKIFSDSAIKKYNLKKYFDLRAENISVDEYCKMTKLI